ncbi:MAG: leucine-rich repeat domain-containing protein [Lachnospiraceae bacterium]
MVKAFTKKKHFTSVRIISLSLAVVMVLYSLLSTSVFATGEKGRKVAAAFTSVKEEGRERITITASPLEDTVIIKGIELPDGAYVEGTEASFIATENGKWTFIVHYDEQLDTAMPVEEVSTQEATTEEEITEEAVTEEETVNVEEAVTWETPITENIEPEEVLDTGAVETEELLVPEISEEVVEAEEAEEVEEASVEDEMPIVEEAPATKEAEVPAVAHLSSMEKGVSLIFGVYAAELEEEADNNEVLIESGAETFSFSVNSIDTPPVNAASDFEFDPATGTIIRYIGSDSVVNIPSEIEVNGVLYPVKKLGKECINGNIDASNVIVNQNITRVIVPEGVTEIGEKAFAGCTNLTSVSLPESLEVIGAQAFKDCWSLPSISIPNGVSEMGTGVFTTCHKLSSLKLPDSLEIISADLVFSCASLTSLTIPDGVKTIDDGAIYNCPKLTEITIPDSVVFVGHRAFDKLPELKRVNLSGNIGTMGGIVWRQAFSACDKLEAIYVNTYRDVPPMLITNTAPWGAPAATQVYYLADGVNFSHTIANVPNEYARNIDLTAEAVRGNIRSIKLPDGQVIDVNQSDWNGVFKATENKTYTFEAVDDSGAVISYDVVIDDIGQPIVSAKNGYVKLKDASGLSMEQIRSAVNGSAADELNRSVPVTISTEDIAKVRGLRQDGDVVTISVVATSSTGLTDSKAVIVTAKDSFISFQDRGIEPVEGEYARNIKVTANAIVGTIVSIKLPDGKVVQVGANKWDGSFKVEQNGSYTFEATDEFGDTTTHIVTVDDIGQPTVTARDAFVKLDEAAALTKDKVFALVQAAAEDELGNPVNIEISDEDLAKVRNLDQDGEAVSITINAESHTGLTDSIQVTITAKTAVIEFTDKVDPVPNEYAREIDITAESTTTGEIISVKLPDGTVVDVIGNVWQDKIKVEENGEYTFEVTDEFGNTSSHTVIVDDIGKPMIIASNAFVDLDKAAAMGEKEIIMLIHASAEDELGNEVEVSISHEDLLKVQGLDRVNASVEITVKAVGVKGLEASKKVRITATRENKVNIAANAKPVADEYARNIEISAASTTNAKVKTVEIQLPDGSKTVLLNNGIEATWAGTYKAVKNGEYIITATDEDGNSFTEKVMINDIGQPTVTAKDAFVRLSEAAKLTKDKVYTLVQAKAADELGNSVTVEISDEDLLKVKSLKRNGEAVTITVNAKSHTGLTDSTQVTITARQNNTSNPTVPDNGGNGGTGGTGGDDNGGNIPQRNVDPVVPTVDLIEETVLENRAPGTAAVRRTVERTDNAEQEESIGIRVTQESGDLWDEGGLQGDVSDEKSGEVDQPEYGRAETHNCILHWLILLATLVVLGITWIMEKKNKKEFEKIVVGGVQ